MINKIPTNHGIQAIPFQLGHIVLTEGARALFCSAHEHLSPFLDRHKNCDWGFVCEEDAYNNILATHKNTRIISEYKVDTKRVWIITLGDRSSTTILLPSEISLHPSIS